MIVWLGAVVHALGPISRFLTDEFGTVLGAVVPSGGLTLLSRVPIGSGVPSRSVAKESGSIVANGTMSRKGRDADENRG